MGKFIKWIEARGIASVAKQLDITSHTVNAWCRGESTPNTELAVRLVRWGRGTFTHDDIVRDTFNRRVRNYKRQVLYCREHP